MFRVNRKILFYSIVILAGIFFLIPTAAAEKGNICNEGCSLDSSCSGSTPYLCKKSWSTDICVAKGFDSGYCGGKTDKSGYCFECSGGCVLQSELGGKCGLFTTCNADEYCCRRAEWYASNVCKPKYSDMGCCGGPPAEGDKTTFLKTTITNNKADACTSKIKWEVKAKNSASFIDYSADCVQGNPEVTINSGKSIEATCTSQKLPTAASGPHKERITWCGESVEFEYPTTSSTGTCKGIVCGGFCYATAFDGKCFNEYFAESSGSKICSYDNDCLPNQLCNNYICVEGTRKTVSIAIETPESIPIKSMFDIKITIKNNLDKLQTVTIEPYWYPPELDYTPVKESITLEPLQTKLLNYKIKGGSYKTFIGKVVINGIYSKPIIVYDPSEVTEKCGNKIYNALKAVCKDNVVYPIYSFNMCGTEKECSGRCICNGDCVENVCINYNYFKPDKPYKVIIVPIFIYDDDKVYNSDKINVITNLENSLKQSNSWFISEKKYWQTNSPFMIEFQLEKECRITKNQYKKLLKKDNDGATFTNDILSLCGVDLHNKPVGVYEYWQKDLKDQEITNEIMRINRLLSTNYGDIFFLADMGSLIHETLHSFGEKDLYLINGIFGVEYQWRDCFLYQGGFAGDKFSKRPHLCNFEASIIGWGSSSGTADISVTLKYPETYGQPSAKSLKLTCKKEILGNIQPVEVVADYESINLGNGLQVLRFRFTKEKLQQLKDAGCDW